MTLKDDIKLRKDYPNSGVHAFLLMARTVWELLEAPDRIIRSRGITSTQFNVLRILRGTPDGLPQHEIRARMVANQSDVSRILSKLVRDGFARRVPSEDDGRVTLGRITRKGLALCAKLDGPVTAVHKQQFERLGARKTGQLIKLLEELREFNS